VCLLLKTDELIDFFQKEGEEEEEEEEKGEKGEKKAKTKFQYDAYGEDFAQKIFHITAVRFEFISISICISSAYLLGTHLDFDLNSS